MQPQIDRDSGMQRVDPKQRIQHHWTCRAGVSTMAGREGPRCRSDSISIVGNCCVQLSSCDDRESFLETTGINHSRCKPHGGIQPKLACSRKCFGFAQSISQSFRGCFNIARSNRTPVSSQIRFDAIIAAATFDHHTLIELLSAFGGLVESQKDIASHLASPRFVSKILQSCHPDHAAGVSFHFDQRIHSIESSFLFGSFFSLCRRDFFIRRPEIRDHNRLV